MFLVTQGTYGTFEYSWYPLTTEEFGVQPGQHIPAHVVQKYLQPVTERFDLVSRIRFGVKVISAAAEEGSRGWLLRTESAAGIETISCTKLIVATGVTSIPRIPDIPGSDEFQGPVIAYKDLTQVDKSAFIKGASLETVTVIGGSKSAHDAVYWSAIAGEKVNWVVPRSGNGVAWMTTSPTYLLSQQVIIESLATTRLCSLFSPCIWGQADGYRWPRWFLHETRVGRCLVGFFWRTLGASVLASTGLHLPKGTELAKPDFDFQWQASSAGTLNYDGDFYSFLRSGQVVIHRKSLDKLTCEGIRLSDGSTLQTDALIHCGGWRWTSPIQFEGISSLEYGIPTKVDASRDMQEWKSQCQLTDARILEKFPHLRSAPPEPYTSWCLHRAIAPPSQTCEKSAKNLAFLGLFSTLPTAALSEIQSLWAIAFLHHRVEVPETAMSSRRGAASWTRWSRLRYPFSQASKYMDTSFDIVPYFDVLLSDMQLRSRRKSSWWRELIEPYSAADYKGLVDEFKSSMDEGLR
ncbi:FAD-dependent monooxygenase DEP4-like protein [Cladobotryum mycophilum]|uniref:FAD-dependent monooxygenase DEP4-like protein n=1 Tax=Cladobotryum mycophilum TaxID=491253 RepID=A0ABR0SH36_9HYPO